jgi:3',5'-nucleoside bisphosphate phosphatase
METIDLHTHSTYSDGTLTPTQLIEHACSLGITAIALTDHDTLGGVGEALEAQCNFDIEVIPGVELSIEYALPDNGHIHMLGLFLDTNSSVLLEGLDWLREQREARTPRIIEKLGDLGIHITEHEVRSIAGNGSVGRPHIARLLMARGFVSSIQEAFDRFLAKGAPAYIPKRKFSLERAIKMIRGAGGIPILAHPYSLKLGDQDLRSLLVRMKGMGLGGIEAFYTDHTSEQTEQFLTLSKELDLGVSGGSDFHGENKPEIRLGSGRGDLSIPSTILDELRSRLDR